MPTWSVIRDDGDGSDGWAERLAHDVASAVAPGLGADGGRHELLRVGASVLVALPDVRVLLRVEPAEREETSRRQVRVGRFLARAGVAAARLAPLAGQPVAVGGRWVTAWELLEAVPGAVVDPADLGVLARSLHLRTAAVGTDGGLPRLDPFAAIAEQLDVAAGHHDDADVALVRSLAAAAADEWAAAGPDPLGTALVHGDLHEQNVVVTAEGLVLVDLEMAGVGPPTYDLAPQLVAVERYGGAVDRYERFTAAYGFDLRDWDGAELRTRTYALWTTAWALGHRHVSAAHRAEAAHRTAYWRDGVSLPWTLR